MAAAWAYFTLLPALLSLFLASPPSCNAEDDPWTARGRTADWDRVDAIQRFPLFDAEPAFDWEAACNDDSVFVRATVALAIGRTPDAKRVEFVIALLRDSAPLVRTSALWALLQIDSPIVKEPLLDVIGSWKDNELRQFTTSAGGFGTQTIGRTGLPSWVTTLPLSERRAWVQKFGALPWNLGRDDSPSPDGLSYGDGQAHVQLCVERSQWDSDEPIAMRVRVSRVGGTKPMRLRIAGSPGSWIAVGRRGKTDDRDEYNDQIFFPDSLEFTTIEPDKSVTVDRVACGNRPLPPGVYLFRGFRAQHGVLVRIRRSVEFERQIPDLLRKRDDPKTIATLGQQRVLAAAPVLIEQFRKSAASERGATFALAGALARIGDPAAVPVLLDFPNLRESDVEGDPSRELSAFGELAYPHYEDRIRAWKRLLEDGKVRALEICLRMLGADGSDEIDRTRLAMVKELLDRRSDYSDAKHHDELVLLQAAVTAVSRRHPERAIECIWSTRDRPHTCVVLIDRMLGSHEQALEFAPIFAALWRRFQELPEPEVRIRRDLMRALQWTTPEVVLDDKFPLASREEALIAIDCARSVETTAARSRALERVTTFLGSTPDAEVQLRLGRLHFAAGNYEQCEEQINAVLAKLSEPVEKSESHYFRGESKIRRGAVADGEEDLKQALALLPPAHGYDGVYKETLESRLREVALIPRAAGLLIQEHVMPWDVRGNNTGEMEWADGRGFFLDGMQNLAAWDPIRREGAALAVIPQAVRDFVPFDRRRVFIAFSDGTAALIEEGAEAPVWKRPFSLGFNSYLSASPAIITAADETGTIHALDAQSGETRWSRKAPHAPWPKHWWQSNRSLIRQHSEFVFIPDRVDAPRSLSAVRATDGTEIWTHRSNFPFDKISIGDSAVFLAGGNGHVTALSLIDGAKQWQEHFDANAKLPQNELAIAQSTDGKQVFLADRDQFWSISAASGALVWKWQWTPRPTAGKPRERGMASPRLCPTTDGLFCVINWEADGQYGERIDVALLTHTGQVLLHETSPYPEFKTEYADDQVAEGTTLMFRKRSMWEVWQFRPPNGGQTRDGLKENF